MVTAGRSAWARPDSKGTRLRLLVFRHEGDLRIQQGRHVRDGAPALDKGHDGENRRSRVVVITKRPDQYAPFVGVRFGSNLASYSYDSRLFGTARRNYAWQTQCPSNKGPWLFRSGGLQGPLRLGTAGPVIDPGFGPRCGPANRQIAL